jgi:hypothetical protein
MPVPLVRAGLVVLMAAGSLLLWIGVPAAWLLLTRGMESAPRFVVTIVGCVITMAAVGWLLFRLDGVYARIAGIDGPEAEPASWERRVGEKPGSRPMTLLERMLVGSALVAVVALIVWWAFFADSSSPSGPLQPL